MIKLVITDLDDTLYSWIGFFIPAFYDMVDELSTIIDVDTEELIKEYKAIHKKKGSVEYPYATIDLPSVYEAYPLSSREERMQRLDEVFHKFNSSRKRNLKLFPTVKETIIDLYKTGICIVGYTESAEENGFYRLKRLGIEKYFTRVYVSDSQFAAVNSMQSSEKTVIVHGLKPSPEILRQICIEEGVSNEEAIYIGDSLTKDIYMAKTARIASVLVNSPFDSDKNQDLYKKLVAISHWTYEDFEREERLKDICMRERVRPDYEITLFSQLKDIINEINNDDNKKV